ncbi:cold-shock protein [Acetobacter sp. UBA5411]|uniref:cold-shock protein n=1 Tax=Acetobacter sp. UBA5411 TaxID=1945905 RepID=UPI0025C20FD3|nr:cold shock domain-containing protein [Acetobacter sp. UBA5411]
MGIYYGKIKHYIKNKGFGFVENVFPEKSKNDIFFHIETIKKTNLKIAEQLIQEGNTEYLYLWYETKITNNREKIINIINTNQVRYRANNSITIFTKSLETFWGNISLTKPSWLEEVTLTLLGNKCTLRLINEREALLNAKTFSVTAQKALEEREFRQLVAELRPLGLRTSKEASYYITKYNLGKKYKNISGVVRMEGNRNQWNFNGGFPPHIYAKLCKELNLTNQNTDARAIGFTPFKNLNL